MSAEELLKLIYTEATRWPRCCDLWQDSLGGMHCRNCEQKTFAMLKDIQVLLSIDKSGRAITPTEEGKP